MISPGLAGVLLTALFILVLSNFNQLITGLPDAPTDDRTIRVSRTRPPTIERSSFRRS